MFEIGTAGLRRALADLLVKIVDIEYLREQAECIGAMFVLSNTFATP